MLECDPYFILSFFFEYRTEIGWFLIFRNLISEKNVTNWIGAKPKNIFETNFSKWLNVLFRFKLAWRPWWWLWQQPCWQRQKKTINILFSSGQVRHHHHHQHDDDVLHHDDNDEIEKNVNFFFLAYHYVPFAFYFKLGFNVFDHIQTSWWW